MKYLYLHGFASSPNSYKANYMKEKFQEVGLTLHVPDLNLTDFSQVTLSEQLDYLERNYLTNSLDNFLGNDEPIAVIGSSLGGFLAVQLAMRSQSVQKLVLFAPAFGFGDRISQTLGVENIAKWQQDGTREFFHYGLKRNVNLHYRFLADAQTYAGSELKRSLPILIFHGLHDEVVPCRLSEEFVEGRSQVTLKLLDDDHALGKDLESMWHEIKQFLPIKG
ncbi:esterase [Pseudanabaena sp. FACHB-1998]|uniref:YqiA/YcfP family alpha/beta fold hydrolase n=1 Tax=Pseudanabaena sp. FACHB-1998 TaxID=2692858 RepID=UPI0016812BD7|nr:YqiA/YcfP family alpha/beta fold hydrolase [Pseudanabaena sp. FACHB-1998]MBD2177620.1 esterase [Pseudanabaena sp. FACHB-1998]